MDLQSLFNIAARKGKASSIFVPPQQQRSFIETVTQQPQRASTVFIPQKQMPSYLETAAQQPQQASTVFIPQKQMPSFLDTATGTVGVSPLFRFPKAGQKPQAQAPAAVPSRAVAAAPMVVAPVTGGGATPIATSAGIVQPNAIVQGLTPTGEVDRSQSDEYKSQLAQYRNLIGQKKEQEAEDLGMKIWMEKYGGKLGLTGPNPLMEGFGGFVPTQGPTPAVLQASDAPLKAFGQEVKTYFPGAGPEGFSPLDMQDQQQQATADQADMATTVKLPVRNRVQAFLQGGM